MPDRPASIDGAAFARYRQDARRWLPLVRELGAAHGLECASAQPFAGGSNLVVAVDDHRVVKILPPEHRHQWHAERTVLPRLRGRLPVRVPELFAAGVHGDWHYLILDRLPGEPLEALWPGLPCEERVRVLTSIGALMAAVHALPPGELATLPPAWDSFLPAQIAGCLRRHTDLGAPAWLLRDLATELPAWHARLAVLRGRVLLTGEYTPGNLLVQRTAAGVRITGMIDFGDAMIGPPEYDLLGPWLFCCGGERALIAALLSGRYGDAMAPPDLRERLPALAALHRYADFDRQVCVPGWREAGSLDALVQRLWPAA